MNFIAHPVTKFITHSIDILRTYLVGNLIFRSVAILITRSAIILMSHALIISTLSFSALTEASKPSPLCLSYLNPEHEDHYWHSSLLTLDPNDVALDKVFYKEDGSPVTFQKPLVWQIKDRSKKTVGFFIGTVHSYASLEMFPPSVHQILAQAKTVMTEHASQIDFYLNSNLRRPPAYDFGKRLIEEIPPTQAFRINTDWLNFSRVKRELHRKLNGRLFFVSHDFSLQHMSAYGFFESLSENADIASTELRTKPVQLDEQMRNYALFHGAKGKYLEEGPDFEIQFAQGHTLKRVRKNLSNAQNIFEVQYQAHKQLLLNYLNGDLKSLEDFVNSMSKKERNLKLTLRNRSWIPRILSELENQEPNLTVIVAGAYHFVGHENLIQLMEEQGYKIEIYR